MLAARSPAPVFPVSHWAPEYLWAVAPFVGAAIASAVAWRSRFFSGWIFAATLVLTLTNPTLYLLIGLALGWRKPDADEGVGWLLFGLPVVTDVQLGALLIGGVVVRLIRADLERRGVSERRRRAATWLLGAVWFCLVVGGCLSTL